MWERNEIYQNLSDSRFENFRFMAVCNFDHILKWEMYRDKSELNISNKDKLKIIVISYAHTNSSGNENSSWLTP